MVYRPRRRDGFTMVEMLVSIAILAILFGLLLRPLMLALEVLSIGRGEDRIQRLSRSLINQLEDDLQGALMVYPNLGTYDLTTGNGTGAAARWRTPQTARLDLVLPARDAAGNLLTPLRPAYTPGNPNELQVVTYWRMRYDPTIDYDPISNPYRLYRAVHSYTIDPATQPVTPDDLWSYAVGITQATSGESLVTVGDDLYPLFQAAGPYDWFIADIDRLNPTGAAPIMRAPTAGAAYTNASGIQAITSLTELDADVREAEFLPALFEGEELAGNDAVTAYKADLGRWMAPYQRESDGQWTIPGADLVPRSSGAALPLMATFRARASRSALMSQDYFVSVEQDPASGRVGHPILYRMQPDTSTDPVPVYDLTDYPDRVYHDQPGNAWSSEFACGINWDTGEIVATFPQQDVICPDSNFGTARIHAFNDSRSTNQTTVPFYAAGSSSADTVWQSFALTRRDAAGNPVIGDNGALLDDYVLDNLGSTRGVWTSYVLSPFRPERLRTGVSNFGGANQADRSLNMSVVPGSVKVVVQQYQVNAGSALDPTAATLVGQRPYYPLRSLSAGALDAGDLEPFKYYLDPAAGRLVFYDPQLDGDATNSILDGMNPPAVITKGGLTYFPVIYVTYEYRNNLPTVDQMMLGDDSGRDVVEASYRTYESIDLTLVLDALTDSTRGETEIINDPLAAAAIERPAGARRRVTVQTVMQVGSGL